MLLLNKKHIDEIKIIDINEYIYAPVTRNDVWKEELVNKPIEVKYDDLQLYNVSKKEVAMIINSMCTSKSSISIYFLYLYSM